MKSRARTVVLGLLGLVIVLVLGGITAIGWQIVLGPKARAVTNRKFEPTETRLARGKYLVEGPAACFHCHSEHDLTNPELPVIQAKKGAGWLMPIPELGTIASRNITPDPETGIGRWTDDEIARAMQEGVSRDGSALFPLMPYMNFAHLDDEDLASIVVYLRTIAPVRNVVATRKLPFPLSILVNTMPRPITAHAAAAPRTTAVARGEYLVRTVAGCGDCHTPADKGQPLPGMEFGGGAIFHDPGQNMKPVASMNITQDPSGIAHYDEAFFVQTLHTGQIPGRMLSPIMPFENFRTMTDDDLKDIFAYLKTLPPVKHRVSNTDPPTACPVCKQVHGLGDLNVQAAGK
jgi:mono/diheme cytochrome c family protein